MAKVSRAMTVGCASFVVSAFALAASEFQPMTLPRVQLDLASMGFKTCRDARSLTTNRHIVVCRDPRRDNEADYGPRLLVVDGPSSDPVVVFESRGAQDAYSRRPTVFSDPEQKRFIILAEDAAEFSYGVAVFLLEANHVKELGYLDVTVAGPENPVSAVPFTRIMANGDEVAITFVSDVLIQEGTDYKSVPQGGVKYVYDGEQLSRVVVPLGAP